MVVDAKYKAEKPAGFPNTDLSRLLGYCAAIGLGQGHLIYAAGVEGGHTYTIPIGQTGSTVMLRASYRT